MSSNETKEKLSASGPERVCAYRMRCIGDAVMNLERALADQFSGAEPTHEQRAVGAVDLVDHQPNINSKVEIDGPHGYEEKLAA